MAHGPMVAHGPMAASFDYAHTGFCSVLVHFKHHYLETADRVNLRG